MSGFQCDLFTESDISSLGFRVCSGFRFAPELAKAASDMITAGATASSLEMLRSEFSTWALGLWFRA